MSRKERDGNIFKWKRSEANSNKDSSSSKYRSLIDDEKSFNLIPDDTAIYEAQQLLDNWMEKQTIEALHLELDDSIDDFSSNHYGSRSCHVNSIQSKAHTTENSFENIATGIDSSSTSLDVDSIIKGLMDKSVINDYTLKKIVNDETIQTDPLMTMVARHNQTKERARKKREQTNKAKLQIEVEKTISEEARKQIANEESIRRKRIKKEDEKIKLEMIKIRKAMHEEKEKIRIANEIKKKDTAIAEEMARKQIETQKTAIKARVERRACVEDKMREHVCKEFENVQLKEKADNFKLLQRYFFSWYDYCLKKSHQQNEMRLLMNWKSQLRYWNRWKRFVQLTKIEKEAEISSKRMRYISRWILSRRDNNQLKQEHEVKKLKMETFLHAITQLKSIEKKANNTRHHDTIITKENKKSAEDNLRFTQSEKCRQKHLLSKNSHVHSERKHENINRDTELSLSEGKALSSTNYESPASKNAMDSTAAIGPTLGNASQREISITANLDSSKRKPKQVELKSKFQASIDDEVPINFQRNELHIPNAKLSCCGSRPTDSVLANSRISSNEKKPPQNHIALDCQSELLTALPVRANKNSTKPILSEMEMRARQRAVRKAEVEEMKRKKDEEKLKELQAKEANRLAEEKRLKAEKIRLHREKKEIEKKVVHEGQLRLEIYRIKCDKADLHRSKAILKLYGLNPWMKLLNRSRLNMEKALIHNSKRNLNHSFSVWRIETRNAIQYRNELAYKYFNDSLLRKSFKGLYKNINIKDHNNLRAMRHNNLKLKKHFLAIWQCYVTNERLAYWTKESDAEQIHERQLIVKSMKQWKCYIAISKLEREQEKRREKLRSKVRTWLPDFEHNKNN